MNKWLMKLLAQLLEVASAPLRDMLVKFAHDFREQAKKTPNPWDDVLADIICWLFQVD